MGHTTARIALRDFAILGGLVAILVLGAKLVLGDTSERVVVLFLINLSAVISLTVFIGFSGLLSFAHVGFMALGAYFGAYLTLSPALKSQFLPALPMWLADLQLPLEIALPIVVVVVAVLALIVGPTICRLPVDTVPIATVAVLVVIHGLIVGAKDLTRGIQPLFGFESLKGVSLPLVYLMVTLLGALLFRASSTGVKLQASRDDEVAAASCGVNVLRVRVSAWVLSMAIIAGSGLLLSHYLTVISPKQFYFVFMFSLLAMGILGGISTVSGAIAGALAVTLLSETTRRIEGADWLADVGLPPLFGLTQITLAALILFVMYRRPHGLIAWREPTRRALGAFVDRTQQHRAENAPAEPAARARRSADAAVLSIAGVSKSFEGVQALKGVSFDIHPGESVGLIGPNGSGKTTLVNIVSGVLPADAGHVVLGSEQLNGLPPHSIAFAGIARTFQNIRIFEHLSVKDNVMVAALSKSRADAADAVAREALSELDLQEVADVAAGELSYGMRRRVEIARALALEPGVLLLDEPSAGMNDVESADLAQRLKTLKQRHGFGFLVIEHDQTFVRSICERIVVLNQGETIAIGTPDEIRKDPAVIEAYLGRSATAERSAHVHEGERG
ncbi:MAG: ATP-binding cassette domain-containing protein [Gammaproteobacteria bacterium]|nr:ATP-binding cassette domain-containing protein [Gammaproteobacteria bacterium]